MNELKIFENTEFGQMRAIEKDGEPWFVGKDVAEILGYERPTKAVTDHVDSDDRDVVPIQDSIGRMQNTPIINESGLYSLILSSKLPDAKKFKRWVTAEVLPSIRKHGGYIAGQENMSDEELVAKAYIVVYNQLKEREAQVKSLEAEKSALTVENQIMKPKALFADAVSSSEQSILVGDLAKLLRQNGYEIGQKRLFEKLRNEGFLIKGNRSDYNMPTQRSMEMGLFEIKETAVTHSDGHISVNKTPKVTGKGQVYFVNRFLAERGIQ